MDYKRQWNEEKFLALQNVIREHNEKLIRLSAEHEQKLIQRETEITARFSCEIEGYKFKL